MKSSQAGFSILEVILAAGLFTLFASGMVTLVILGFRGNRLGNEQTTANQYAVEGIEALRSIKNQSYALLTNSASTGIAKSGTVWAYSGSSNTFDKYTRVLTVSDVQRDGSGNIVASGGTVDPNTKKATSTVTWNVTPTRTNSVVLNSYFTNWKAAIVAPAKGGMLVYGDGGTTADTMKYQILDGTTGLWSAAANTADVDAGTTNKTVRAARLYSSATRNEKILLTRHWDNSSQTFYAQVWNGTSWGNVVQLSQVFTSQFLDVRNFDGTYLSNGDFMVVYFDNTTIPKFRTWNGTAWSSAVATQTVGGSPNYIIARARPGTKEVMVATFDQSNRTSTEYFNGGTYTTANWTAATTHASAAPNNQRQFIDFTWDINNPLKGAIVYVGSANPTNMVMRVWTANGTGGGSWSGAQNSPAVLGNIGTVGITSRKGADDFHACNQDSTGKTTCFKATTAPVWSTPTNNVIALQSDGDIQRSYDLGFESTTGTTGWILFGDSTVIPKIKKYTVGTTSWDLTATSLTALSSTVKTSRVIPQTTNDDAMFLIGDGNRSLYSVKWNGTSDAVYTSPTGYAFTAHGTNGSAANEYWYDFAWDIF